MDVGIITNPRSRKNRARAARIERLHRYAGDDGLVRATDDLSGIRPVVEEFIDRGCRYWIADGGDGTLHWLLNEGRAVLEDRGLWDGVSPFPYPLVPTNGGTIDFVARRVGIRGRSDAVIRRLVQGLHDAHEFELVEVPTLEVTGHLVGDLPGVNGFRQLGFATAIGGVGQKFFAKYYESPNPNPWTIIEIAIKAGAGHLFGYLPFNGPAWFEDWKEHGRSLMSGTRAEVIADGKLLPYDVYQGLHVGSVCIDFGTMKLFPFADQPGRLHLVAGTLDRSEIAWKWMWLVAGKPVPGGTWHEFAGQTLEVRAREGEVLEPVIDGETFEAMDWLKVEPGPVIRVPRVKAGA